MKTMKLILAFAVLFIAHLASAEMLYWMIGDSSNGGSNNIEFNYALLYAVNDDEKIALPTTVEGGGMYGNDDLSLTTTTGKQMTELDGINPSVYSYYVELVTWNDAAQIETVVGVSDMVSYSDLASQGHIIGAGMTIPATAVLWMPATHVPEPSSAMLLLFGISYVLLKRRVDKEAGNMV